MVCIRCQMIVKAELEKLGLHYIDVKIGEANIIENIRPEQLEQLDSALRKSGLLLMDDKKSILVEKIKSAIIEGAAEVIINEKTNILQTGQAIIIPAHTSNIIKANERFKMISTVIKSGYEGYTI